MNRADPDQGLRRLNDMIQSGEGSIARVELIVEDLETRLEQQYQVAQARLATVLQSIENSKQTTITWTADALGRLEETRNAMTSQMQVLQERMTDATSLLTSLLADAEASREHVDGVASQIDASVDAFGEGITEAGEALIVDGEAWVADIRGAEEKSSQRLERLVDSGVRFTGELDQRVSDLQDRMSEGLEMLQRQSGHAQERSQHAADAVAIGVPPTTALTISMLSGAIKKNAGQVEELLSTARALEDVFSRDVEHVLSKVNKILDLVEEIEPALKLIRQLA